MNRFVIRCAAGAVFLVSQGLVLTTNAQASVVSLNAGISNFSYRLVDLAPDDGVAPWVAFTPPPADYSTRGPSPGPYGVLEPSGQEYSVFSPNYARYNGVYQPYAGLLPTTPVAASSRDQSVTAQASSTGMSVGTDLANWRRIDPANQSTNPAGYSPANIMLDGRVSSGSLGQLSPYEMTYGPNAGSSILEWRPAQSGPTFTLSPHTAIYFEGTVGVQYQLDLDSMPTQFREDGARLDVRAEAMVGVQQSKPTGSTAGLWPDWQSAAAAGAVFLQNSTAMVSASIYGDDGPNAFNERQDFSLALTNDSNEDMKGDIALNADVWMHLTASPVPEPGTCALMGLGLVGIGWAARRRQRV